MFLSSLKREQWVVLWTLLIVSGVGIPLVVYLGFGAPLPATSLSMATLQPTATHTIAVLPSATARASPTTRSSPTILLTPTSTKTRTAAPTPSRSPSLTPDLTLELAKSLAKRELDPAGRLASESAFFTSVCYGAGVNLLQDQDYLGPSDWKSSLNRGCTFGYRLDPATGQPTGRYYVEAGPDGESRFYLVPPTAFGPAGHALKQLTQLQLIADPNPGCEALGLLGMTADGETYQCSACAFLKAGGVCPSLSGSKSLALPVNSNTIFDPRTNGGAYGFVGFPLVIFRDGFSLFFSGRGGAAPRKLFFEIVVDTLAPEQNVPTTAEMSDRTINVLASQFDELMSSTVPITRLMGLEHQAEATTPARVVVKPREEAAIGFVSAPGSVLSSIAWTIRPTDRASDPRFLETNICLAWDGTEACFTGVEDFAHCAFYTACRTGYSSLVPLDGEGYTATRYFPAGTAPLLRDGKVTARVRAPDIGTSLQIEVQVRVR